MLLSVVSVALERQGNLLECDEKKEEAMESHSSSGILSKDLSSPDQNRLQVGEKK